MATTSPFALLEQRLGAATTAAFFNVGVVLPAGTALQGTLSQPYAEGPGNLAMPGRDVVLVCRTADLAAETVVKGTVITTTQAAGSSEWQVVRRADVLELGDTELQLERT